MKQVSRKIKIYIYVKGTYGKMSIIISDEPEPSYEGSKPSRAELGHFNFRAETELDFFLYSLIVRFLGPRKNVLMEILTIRGVFMVGGLKTGIFELKSPLFFIEHSTEKIFCI